MTTSFELKDLTISGVVNHLNLRLKQGEIALLKTSGEQETKQLLKVIIGESLPESGSVLLDDQALGLLDREHLLRIRKTLATVTAQAGLISNLKVWENITLPLLYHHGAVPEEAAEKALQLLEKLGYKGNIWALPGHLSYSERIMTAFVRAAVSSPRLIVYAECFDDLQNQQRKQLLHHAIELQNQPDAPAALFLITGDIQLPLLEPDVICNLRHNPPQITRQK